MAYETPLIHGAPPVEQVDCRGCVACCRYNKVMLMSYDDHTLYEVDTVDQPNPVTGESPTRWLKHRADGACIYLGDRGCTIYHERPSVCRTFSCVGWVKKILRDYPDRADRRRWQREHASLNDRAVWKAGMERLNE